jgi:hypothetical protein
MPKACPWSARDPIPRGSSIGECIGAPWSGIEGRSHGLRAHGLRAHDPRAHDPRAHDPRAHDPRAHDPRATPTVRRPRLRFVTARPQPGSSGSSPVGSMLGVGDGGVQPARGFDKMGAWSQPGTARIRAADPNPGGHAARVSAAAVPGRTGPARSARRGRRDRAGGRHAVQGRSRRCRTGPPGAARLAARMVPDVVRRGRRRPLSVVRRGRRGRGVARRRRQPTDAARRGDPVRAAGRAGRERRRRRRRDVGRRERRVGAVGRDVGLRGEQRAA